MYDTIIIGAGAAGITAAIYAARAKLKFLIISMDVGGLTLWSPDIENYTGFHKLSGIELVEKFREHMKDYDIKVIEDSINKVDKKGENFIVKTDNKSYETKTVIVASGSSPRKLDVPGGDEFEGKGVAYCATCDGPLFADRDVAVIGGGDGALATALTLIEYAKSIHIINLNSELTGTDNSLTNTVKNNKKVKITNNAKTKEVIGDKFVTGLKYEVDGKEQTLDIQGVFVEIGHIRNTKFVEKLVKLNEHKEIITDKTGATSQQGIYAAGDITDLPGKQSIIAAGDGSRALLSAFKYIKRG